MTASETPILIIDDEEIVLLAITESLLPEGYNIVKTTKPEEALELLKKQEFSVIISDHHMPGMTGLEFFAEANKIQPMASRILITGVLTLKVVVDAINKGEIFRFIAKPWIREELLATVSNAIHRYELLSQNTALQADTEATNARLAQRNKELEAQVNELQSTLLQNERNSSDQGSSIVDALQLTQRILHNIDPELGHEAGLVSTLCTNMAKSGRLEPDTADLLELSSYFPTLGKINVDPERLKEFIERPNHLHSDEIEYFHNLPIYSQLHAASFTQIPSLSRIVRASHERLDGNGYPDGLRAEDIPEAAKYLAVAVFYAESLLSTSKTLEQIRRLSGTAFDAAAVSLFFEVNSGLNLNVKTRSVSITELKPGDVIGEDLRYPSGAIFLPKGSSLSESTIAMLDSPGSAEPKNSYIIYN
ncbi:MAG: response regulator [Opitutales bacterium]|nr:response regulator [Opitutales bacterium]